MGKKPFEATSWEKEADLSFSLTTKFWLFLTETVCNFKFEENGRKFSKWVENTVGKGEIARYEHFFPFPTVFSKDFYSRHEKKKYTACLGKGEEKVLLTRIFFFSHNVLNCLKDKSHLLTLYLIIPGFKDSGKKSFENIVIKEQSASYHLLLLPWCFCTTVSM